MNEMINKGKQSIANVIATLTPELLQNATVKAKALNIADDTLNKLTVSVLALDSIDTATTYAKAQKFYEIKTSIASNKSGQFKNFKEYCTHIGVDNSNATKWAKVYETIISNDSLFPHLDGFNLSALIIISGCNNFSEFLKLIDNGTVKVPNVDNNFKGTSNAELAKYVKAINAGVVNISASNIEEEKPEESKPEENKPEENKPEENKPEEKTPVDDATAFRDWLKTNYEKVYNKYYTEYLNTLK